MVREGRGVSSKEELKRTACDTIEKRSRELISIAKDILQNPETGFNEQRTATLVGRKFAELGVPYREGLAITGVKGRIKGGGPPGPSVAVLGELDSLIVGDHPHADAETGAAHACGHNAQIAMMLGAVMGLQTPEVLSALSGTIVPFAVPAEEFVEVEQRLSLREEGALEFLARKQELIRLGEFDDVDMAVMCHTASNMGERKFSVGGTSNGHIVKYFQYAGRSAHSGGAPHMGINALNAATLALAALQANRETFTEQETARVHGIITKGGEAVNVVPSDVRLEWRVRSAKIDELMKNNAIADRCFKAGAVATGARLTITNIPGYFPLRHDPTLENLFHGNATTLLGRDRVSVIPDSRSRGGSTDMGDLSQIMPVCHPYAAGADGPGHSKEYAITDYQKAVINPAKIMAMVVIDLLAEESAKAREVLNSTRPAMAKETYIARQRRLATVEEFDGSGF